MVVSVVVLHSVGAPGEPGKAPKEGTQQGAHWTRHKHRWPKTKDDIVPLNTSNIGQHVSALNFSFAIMFFFKIYFEQQIKERQHRKSTKENKE